MNESLLRKIHCAGAKLLRDCSSPPRSSDGWRPFTPEPLKAALSVEEHRWFWRPKKVKFALLAESHVYTDGDDLECNIDYDGLNAFIRKPPPRQFVRLVYCLGYGNDQMLDRVPKQVNSGTNEYWELLGRCAGTWNKWDSSLSWKIQTLRILKDKGVWLADASIHACMNPRLKTPWRNLATRFKNTLYKELINLSWVYVRPTIEEAKEIWYVGNNLKSVLQDKILNPTKSIPQPAGRRNPKSREEYNEKLPKLIAAVRKVCN